MRAKNPNNNRVRVMMKIGGAILRCVSFVVFSVHHIPKHQREKRNRNEKSLQGLIK